MGRNAIYCVTRRNSLAVTLFFWPHGRNADPAPPAVKAGYFYSPSPPDAAAESRAT